MIKQAVRTLTIALVAIALTGPAALAVTPPYSTDFESVALGEYVDQQTDWDLPDHLAPSPVVTDAQAFSGAQSITDNEGAGSGMQLVFDEPVTAQEVVLSFAWYKEDWANPGEDDRVRMDVHTEYDPEGPLWRYSGTVVVWDGDVLNDSDLSEKPVEGLQLNTWYRLEWILTRNAEDTQYENDTTINIYNADGSLFGSGAFTLAKGSRVPLEQLATVHLSFRGDRGIHIDDVSVTAILPECEPGDADKDGDVDDDDLSLLLANWGQEVTCTKGEFSGEPPVNDDDLSLLLANWTGPLVSAVPEPMTLMLLIPAAALIRRRK